MITVQLLLYKPDRIMDTVAEITYSNLCWVAGTERCDEPYLAVNIRCGV